MSITLSDGTTVIDLHKDLLWSDEMSWSPVQQTVEQSITGSLIVQIGVRQAGRPITLESEDGESAAMLRSVVDQLRNWAAVPGKQMTLTLRGVTRNVLFRLQDGPAIDATPWIHRDDVEPGDKYLCTFKFMEI